MKRFIILLIVGVLPWGLSTSAADRQVSADALFAEGDFAAAARAYEEAVKASPSDVNAQAGLARIRLFENRNDEAIALAQKVLGAQPGHPGAQRTLAVAQERKAAFGADRYQMAAPPVETVIPFVTTDPLPVIKVRLGGREASLLIDTGGADLMISPELAKSLGLEAEPAGERIFAGGVRAPIQRTMVPELEMGPIEIRRVPATLLGVTLKNDGILGTGVLMHFLSTLDYCHGRLVFRPRSASAVFQQEAARQGANIVPMWFVADHLIFARAHLLHGSEGAFLIDTGFAGGGLLASKATLDEAGIAINPSNTLTGLGGGGPTTAIGFRAGATIGSLTVENVRGAYSPQGDGLPGLPFKQKGVLSHAVFRQTQLSFDFEAMRLVTETCRAGP